MKNVMVRYTVRPDRVEENERYVSAVFEQLDHERPPGLRYASFKLEDGVSFVHIVSVDTEDAVNPLNAIPAFKAFTATVDERCDERPVVSRLSEVGSYQWDRLGAGA